MWIIAWVFILLSTIILVAYAKEPTKQTIEVENMTAGQLLDLQIEYEGNRSYRQKQTEEIRKLKEDKYYGTKDQLGLDKIN